MNWPLGNGRAIGIVRVSTHKQKDNNSPAIQRADIESYAKRNGLTLVEVVEIHESAKVAKRRHRFREALEQARTGRIEHLLFWRSDRFTRNFTDLESMQDAIGEGAFVAVHFVRDANVLHAKSASGDWTRAKMEAFVANEYSSAVAERAATSTDKHAADGHLPCRAPIGYINKQRLGPDGQLLGRNGYVELTDAGRRLLQRMRDLRLQGQSLSLIAETVLRERLVPERSQAGFRGANCVSRVEQLLKNPFYVGIVCWRGQQYPGKHEPVFSRQEWDELQATFGKRAPYARRKHEGTFSGFVRCSICGCTMVYDPKTKPSGITYLYYTCSNMKRAHDKRPRTTEAELMKQFGRVVEQVNLSEPRAKQIADALNEIEHRAHAARTGEIDHFKAELSKLEVREDALYDNLSRGLLDDESYKRQLERVRADRRRYTDLMANAQQAIGDAVLITAKQLIELATQAKSLWEKQTPKERRAFLDETISNPVSDGRSVRYDLKKPFRLIAEMGSFEGWRARKDLNLRPSDS